MNNLFMKIENYSPNGVLVSVFETARSGWTNLEAARKKWAEWKREGIGLPRVEISTGVWRQDNPRGYQIITLTEAK